MKKFIQLLLATSLLALSGVASALPITGSIIFGGDLTYDFNTNAVDILGDDALVTAAPTGGFSSVAYGAIATYNDFSYDPLSVATGTLWSVGGFSFVLNQISTITETTDIYGNTSLFLAGSGLFSSTNAKLDDTAGSWTFSADGRGSRFAFSSTNVPEPSIALLLGAGLIGFGFARKARKAA